MLPRKCVPLTSAVVAWSALPSSIAVSSLLLAPSRVQSIAIDRAPPPEKNGDPATAVNAPVVASTV
jgi:hypothetical protein